MKIPAALLAVLALAIGIASQFTECEVQGCQRELAGAKFHKGASKSSSGAGPGAFHHVGHAGPTSVCRGKEFLRIPGLFGSLPGATAILFPTSLIGVCGNPDMIRKSIIKPLLSWRSGIVVTTGLIARARIVK